MMTSFDSMQTRFPGAASQNYQSNDTHADSLRKPASSPHGTIPANNPPRKSLRTQPCAWHGDACFPHALSG